MTSPQRQQLLTFDHSLRVGNHAYSQRCSLSSCSSHDAPHHTMPYHTISNYSRSNKKNKKNTQNQQHHCGQEHQQQRLPSTAKLCSIRRKRVLAVNVETYTCEDDSKPETPSMALETPNKMAVTQLPSTMLPPTITSGKSCHGEGATQTRKKRTSIRYHVFLKGTDITSNTREDRNQNRLRSVIIEGSTILGPIVSSGRYITLHSPPLYQEHLAPVDDFVTVVICVRWWSCHWKTSERLENILGNGANVL